MNNKSRSIFALGLLWSLLFSAVPLVSGQQKKPKKTRYNVLFIASDDLRPELGAYGTPLIQTPNIDRLAARSTRFDNAYAQYPVCNPSRTSLLTGRYPTQTGVMNNNDYFRRKFPDWVTLPQYFKNNGYATLRSGKIFHGGIDDEVSWTEGGEPVDPNITERGNPNFKPKTTANPDPDDEERAPVPSGSTKASNSDRIVVLDGDGEKHGDYRATTRAIAMLEKYRDKPFFLALGLVKPHSPPTAPKKFFDLYDLDKIPLPVDFRTTPKAPDGFPPISIPPRNADLFIGRESTPELAREMKRAYWASVSFVDAQVGRILEALEKNGLKDNTIVVFWGDHGYHLGEKGKWSKAYSMYEVGLRVPLLIAVPKEKPNASDRVVELIDLYATLADLCGLPPPPGIEGASLGPLLKKPEKKWDRVAYSVVDYRGIIGKSVRTSRWHYVEWADGKEGSMLFEHPQDKLELKNLATDPKYAPVIAEMKKLLAKIPK
ncbi:MAG: sulfatase [Acidobacteria bacterium]|nr:sulfatase [Acidobacteriota bacterium]